MNATIRCRLCSNIFVHKDSPLAKNSTNIDSKKRETNIIYFETKDQLNKAISLIRHHLAQEVAYTYDYDDICIKSQNHFHEISELCLKHDVWRKE